MDNILNENFAIENQYFYENGFYLATPPNRIAKFIAHYELYKKITNLSGAIVECGVYKGISLMRLAKIRRIIENDFNRKIVGFDVFGEFPKASYEKDINQRELFLKNSLNTSESISLEKVSGYFKKLNIENIEFVKGNILETLPNYLDQHPEFIISYLHIDVDLYEATKASLEYLFQRVVKGGIVVFDDYGFFAGANKAIEEFFPDIHVNKFSFSHTPSYIIK